MEDVNRISLTNAAGYYQLHDRVHQADDGS